MPGAAAAWDRRLLATALQATVPMTASPIDPPPGVDQAGGHRPAGGAVPGTCTLPSPADADPHRGPRRRPGERSPHDRCDLRPRSAPPAGRGDRLGPARRPARPVPVRPSLSHDTSGRLSRRPAPRVYARPLTFRVIAVMGNDHSQVDDSGSHHRDDFRSAPAGQFCGSCSRDAAFAADLRRGQVGRPAAQHTDVAVAQRPGSGCGPAAACADHPGCVTTAHPAGRQA